MLYNNITLMPWACAHFSHAVICLCKHWIINDIKSSTTKVARWDSQLKEIVAYLVLKPNKPFGYILIANIKRRKLFLHKCFWTNLYCIWFCIYAKSGRRTQRGGNVTLDWIIRLVKSWVILDFKLFHKLSLSKLCDQFPLNAFNFP